MFYFALLGFGKEGLNSACGCSAVGRHGTGFRANSFPRASARIKECSQICLSLAKARTGEGNACPPACRFQIRL